MKPITIVIATYNGERFLEEQFLSIVGSIGFDDLVEEIIIRDDGSTDDTLKIINTLSEKYSILKTIRDSDKGSGAKDNFSKALGHIRSPFAMTCDQDDIWMSNKIADSFYKIKELYQSSPVCFAFSDVEVVNDKLETLFPSFLIINNMKKNDLTLEKLMVNNFAPGCSSIFSKELLDISLPIPDDAIMHDWWLILNAALHGSVGFIDNSLMKYRQHGSNAIGYKNKSFFEKFKNLSKEIKEYKLSCYARRKQIFALLGNQVHSGKLFFLKNEKTWKRKLMALILA